MTVIRSTLKGLLLLLVPWVAAGQETGSFGAATFTAPAGFALDGRPTMQAWSRIRGPELCMIVAYGDEPSPPTLEASYVSAWRTVFNSENYRRADLPDVTESTSPAGYRHAAGEGELVDRGGNRFIARLHVFPVGEKTQTIVWLGNSRTALESCRPDWNAFFGSLRFPSVEPSEVASGPPAEPARDTAVPAEPTPPAQTPIPGGASIERFDNITFTVPGGWAIRRTAAGVRLSPSNLQGDERLEVRLMSGRRSDASLESEFERTWSEIRTELEAELLFTPYGRNYDLEEPGVSLRGWPYLNGTGAMRRADGIYAVEVYVIRAGDRLERVAVLAPEFHYNLVPTNAALNPLHARSIRELVFTMRFASQPERTKTPALLDSGGISGVWAGLGMSMGTIKTQYAVFFDNGTAFFGPVFPERGLYEIDPAVEQPAFRRYWGTYVMTGDEGVLTMPFGDLPLRRDGAALEVTSNRTAHRFVRFAIPDSAGLEGTWCTSGARCLTLRATGRFVDAGAVREVERSTYPFPASPAEGEGDYAVRDHTLILRYDRGPELRIALIGVEQDHRPLPETLRVGSGGELLSRN